MAHASVDDTEINHNNFTIFSADRVQTRGGGGGGGGGEPLYV